MRIAIFIEAYLPQSTAMETHAALLAKGLKKLKHDVLVVTSDLEAENCYQDGDFAFAPAKLSGSSYGQSAKDSAIPQLKKSVDNFHPDIIHLLSFGNIGSFGLEYALRNDLPLLAEIHDLEDAEAGFGNNHLAQKFQKARVRTVLKKAVSFADLTVNSSKEIPPIFESLGVNPKISPVPLCVDNEIFHLSQGDSAPVEAMRKRLGISGKTGVLFVGRLTDDNQVQDLLESWSKLISVQDKLQLIIVGTGPELPSLMEAAKLHGISSQVSFAGQIPHEEMCDCYDACSAFVSASCSQTIKVSPLEAIACGLPVILPAASATAKVITDGVNGFLYEEPKKMAELLKKLTTLDKKTQGIMKALVARTAEGLTPENQAKALLECYRHAQELHAGKNASARN